MSPLTPDHVNPERPWPQIDELAARTAAQGFDAARAARRSTGYIREPWLDPRVAPHVAALADPETGLAREEAMPQRADAGRSRTAAGARPRAGPTCT